MNDGSPFNNNPVLTNKLYFTKEKFVHEEIVCFYLFMNDGYREYVWYFKDDYWYHGTMSTTGTM